MFLFLCLFYVLGDFLRVEKARLWSAGVWLGSTMLFPVSLQSAESKQREALFFLPPKTGTG